METKNDIIVFKKVSIIDKFNFYEYLSIMLDSGVGIGDSLESVLEKISNPYFRQKIEQLLVFISSGDSLSKAMKKDPHTFSAHEISVVEAGEATGTLSSSLLNIAENLKNIYELKKKIKSSLTYPVIIFLFLFIAVIIVLTYVIPAIMPLFENSEVELPKATKALIITSDFVTNNFLLLIFFLFFIFVLFVAYKGTKTGKENIDNFLLSLPLIGMVYKNYILANMSLSMGNLIGAGVPTLKVLKLTGKSSGSYVYEKIFDMVTKRVELGEKIVDAMIEVDPERYYFPSTYLQMLSVGEKTANMEVISKKIHKQYIREVEYSLDNLTKLIEPMAIVIAAIFVIWFVFAIFGAIMKIIESVN